MLAVETRNLAYAYGSHKALKGLSLNVSSGSFFGLVGPNGGGKSTLFSILATLKFPQSGEVKILGIDVKENPAEVRKKLGVVFQNPALDKKLSVSENLACHGWLHGLRGKALKARIAETLEWTGLSDRARDRVQKLSGGLARRVEIAKGVLHNPEILILDEPTTGLDPAARRIVWDELRKFKARRNGTVLLTTHLLDEADQCDRVLMLDKGECVAEGSPKELKDSLGGESIVIRSGQAEKVADSIRMLLKVSVQVHDQEIRFQSTSSEEVGSLLKKIPEIDSLTVGRPTLEDFFLQKTGARISEVSQ